MMFSFRAIVDVAQRRDEVGWHSLAVPSHQLAPILVERFCAHDGFDAAARVAVAARPPQPRRLGEGAAIGGDPPHKRMHAAR